MIYTSYFKVGSNMDNCFSVYPQTPPWYTKKVAIELCPDKELYKKYKNCKINSNEFVEEYYATVLENLNAEAIAKKYDNAVLLGWYKEDNDLFIDCRSVIAFWLNQNGFMTRELTQRDIELGFIV